MLIKTVENMRKHWMYPPQVKYSFHLNSKGLAFNVLAFTTKSYALQAVIR